LILHQQLNSEAGDLSQVAPDENYSNEEKVRVLEQKKQVDIKEDISSYTNIDGSPYEWHSHALLDTKGLIYIHNQKEMKQPEGIRAKEWVNKRCDGFELNLEGIRDGMCYKKNTHPFVVDQRICKATKSDDSYANNKAF